MISELFSAAMPVFQGCIFAYVINILMSFYERHYFVNSTSKAVKASRYPVCMIGALIGFTALIPVVGSSIGLPAFWVLASVTIAGSVAGIPGILFGIPLCAAAYRLIRKDMHKNDPVETESCE